MKDKYDRQARGSADGYASYYAGMDKTMRQKVALISSYLPAYGRVADMGCGSGKGSFDIASLYPQLAVTGVDISPESVAYCRENFKRSNLNFEIGDIAEKVFKSSDMDAILNSSVLHHVTSFNSFDVKKIHQLLDHQISELKPGGILAVRDFVVPEGPGDVELELQSGDLEPSTADLFEIFCRDFKCADFQQGGVPYKEVACARAGFRRFRVDFRRATEFLLRKDYRKDWDVELLEEYLYFSQKDFEDAFESRGLRLLLSRPIYNQWIIANRWRNQVYIYDLSGGEVPYPPTNFMIIGQKVEADAGVHFVCESREQIAKPSFLQVEHFQESGTEQVWDLVSRPHPTVDLIPWFESAGEIFVLSRAEYPRPIAIERDRAHALEKLTTSGFMCEPIAFAVAEGADVDARILRELAKLGFNPSDVLDVTAGHEFLPSAGGSGEKVTQYFVKLKSGDRSRISIGNPHGFCSVSTIRALAAEQTLRAYCTGGMLDNRLEIACFWLLRHLGRNLGPWIGDEITSRPIWRGNTLSHLVTQNDRRFSVVGQDAGFLQVCRSSFVERNARGERLASVPLEYVAPAKLSVETLIALPFAFLEDGEAVVGIEERFLPASQKYFSTSCHHCAPAWRLSRAECGVPPESLIAAKLKGGFGLESGDALVLGSGYMPSPGTSPETCTVYAAPILGTVWESPVQFYRLPAIMRSISDVRSGHLLTALYRLRHALGSA